MGLWGYAMIFPEKKAWKIGLMVYVPPINRFLSHGHWTSDMFVVFSPTSITESRWLGNHIACKHLRKKVFKCRNLGRTIIAPRREPKYHGFFWVCWPVTKKDTPSPLVHIISWACFTTIHMGGLWHSLYKHTVPSGNLLYSYGKIYHFQWVNPLFLRSFSIATQQITRE